AINLSLKEDKKNGYFGDLEAGYGTDDRYQGKMNLNRFGKGAQLSVIGMGNNVNEQGFSLDEYINFSGGLGSFLGGANEGGRVRLDLNDAGLPLSLAQQDGILSTHAGGLNFNQDFGKRTELRSSYFFNHVNTDLDRSTRQQSLLTENGFTSEGDSKFASDNTNHRLNVNLRHRIDSFQNLGWQSSLGYNTADQENRSTRRSFNDRQEAENEGIRQFASQGDNLLLRSSLVYRRRFRKRGRLFVADASLGLRSNEAASRLDSRNTFFQQAFTDRINQRQSQDEQLNSYGLRLSYTEPLQKGRYLEFNFAHQTVDNQLDKEFYDQLPMGEQFNEELSRFYTQQYAFDRAGINFRWNRRKSKLTLGAAMQYYRLQGQLSNEVQSVRDSYVRFLPSLRYKRDFGQANELTFAYRTSIQEPSLEQLQPIVDNSDPLRQYIGNPDLIPEYIHDLELRYLLFSQFSQISLFANAGLSYTRNKITQAQSIDAQLQQVIQPLNVDEDWLARANISFGSPLRFMKSRSSVNLGSNYSRSIVFVNGQRNLVQRQSYNLEYSISNRSWDKIDFRFGADLGWNKVRYDLLQDLNQSYLSQTYFADLTVFVGKNTELNSIFDYSRYSDESFGAAQSVPLWRASITQYVFQKKGRFILSVYDILDRNLGIRRSNAFNFVQEVRSNALRRYVSLGFGWSLSGFDQKKGGIEIDTGGRRR
ncbi:MAG: outer membrane beta-barrel protein, partial [Bacteroidota bacterium]